MGVFQRMKDITRASLNDMLDKVEDPVVMLNQYLRDMEEEIAQAEVGVAKQMATERKLRQRLDESVRLSMDREAKAMEALRNGEEARARMWLEEKLYHDEKVKEIRDLYLQAKNTVEELVQQLHEMKDQYYHMRNKRHELAVRAQMAKTRKHMAQVSSAHVLETGLAARGFHRMEEKIMQMEIEAEILRKPHLGQRDAVNPYQATDAATQQKIEEQLQALREKVRPEQDTRTAPQEPSDN